MYKVLIVSPSGRYVWLKPQAARWWAERFASVLREGGKRAIVTRCRMSRRERRFAAERARRQTIASMLVNAGNGL